MGFDRSRCGYDAFIVLEPATRDSLTKPLVSVALCTFNGAAYIGEQLQTIAGQSQRVDEIILCDDGSVDPTLEIVAAMAATFPVPIIVHRNPERLGITKNFEKAISLCRGEYIFLCDQDDRWDARKVKTLVDRLVASKVGMVFSNAAVVNDDLSPLGYRMWESIWFDAEEQARVKSGNALPVLLRHAIAAGSTMAFRSEYLPLLLPIPDLPHSHDIWITLLLGCIGKIEPVDEDLIQYRLHGRNEVGMRQYSLLDQVRMARHQIKNNTFSYLAQLHQAAYERLTNQTKWPVHPNLLVMLQDKIRHSDRRHDLPRRWLRRLGTVGSELRQDNYRKYSYGWKSVLQDLFLR